ncbi:MAG: YfhO family protein [Bacteroidales bacterium]|nr:YfhO family protein [Bacteroidales bacterium]
MKPDPRTMLKKWWPYLTAAVVFVALTLIYCAPVLEGRVIQAGDNLNWKGMYQEMKTFQSETKERTFWTGSMFSGMPTYQIGGGNYKAAQVLKPLRDFIRLGNLKNETLLIILGYLICFFILLRSFRINPWLCIVGAVAIAFSSYFFIIIEAGHNTKALGLAWMTAVLAGFVLIYRGKYLLGAILTMVYSFMGVMCHPQMTYYIFLFAGLLFIAELYIHIRERRMKEFGLATLCFVAALAVGAGTQYSNIKANSEYSRETMRGGHSELQKATDAENKTGGLDLDYATAWSYGLDETFTLLIPNFKGASSHYNVGENSRLYKTLVGKGVPRRSAAEFCQSVPTYWGTQPFTSGPVYVGAIVCLLFVFGLLVVKGPYKWAILAATVFSVLLSWGRNFMPLTELFFHYFPMYNKFRAVSSILVVAEIAMPLLAFLSLKALMDGSVSRQEGLGKLWISAGITGGLCLLFALFGKVLYHFTAPADAQMFAQLPAWLTEAIVDERAAMLRADAFRSLAFIVLGAGVVALFMQEKIKPSVMIVLVGVLVLADMWPVNKRFLSDADFVTVRQNNSYFKMQPYEEAILQDKDPHFRVLNLASNTFNDSRTSYYLKSLGGYHAAKLRRYQDLIDQHLSKMNMDVINMLNAKYIIYQDNNGNVVPQLNPQAMGNAWYVDSLLVVNTPNEECDALNHIDLHHTAVLDAKFAGMVGDFQPGHDATARVKLTSYKPNGLTYETSSAQDGTVVFSEIYYPYGWKAYIDEVPTDHFRVNYALRAMNVPAGQHQIRFEFQPDSIYKGDRVSMICAILIYLTLLFGCCLLIRNCLKRKEA